MKINTLHSLYCEISSYDTCPVCLSPRMHETAQGGCETCGDRHVKVKAKIRAMWKAAALLGSREVYFQANHKVSIIGDD